MFKERCVKKHKKAIELSQDQKNNSDKDEGKPNKQQQIKGQPSKKVKTESHRPNIISFSTTKKQDKRESNLDNFPGINYKATNCLNSEIVLENQLPFEQQEAKLRFLENVEATKLIKEGKLSKKIYRGNNNYANYSLTPTDLNNAQEVYKFRNGPGPSRTNNNVKNTCRFDFNPQICKDWHDSGYCVFGNSCLYLHDRSNYKTGWELEKQFQQNQRERWKRINNPDYKQKPEHIDQAEKYKVDQICKFCSNTFKNPVSVDCGHIFCLKCATSINQNPGKCTVCNKKLSGIMNNSQKMLKKQKQLYHQMVKKLQKQSQQLQGKRKKHQQSNSIDVFKD